MAGPRVLRIVEVATGVAGPACGRLFAGLGHDVVKCELPGGDPLRARAPLNADGVGLEFVALNADKASVVLPPDSGPAALGELLQAADVLILGLLPAEADALGITADWLAQRRPGLVVVRITGFGDDPDYADVPGDSLLAEAYGGLATMIGSPDRRPLALGGAQTEHCAAVTGFLGAMVALLRRDAGAGGDVVEVELADVAAYMDWKSDLVLAMTGAAPVRTDATSTEWRLVRAADGWVGFIFQQKHWPAMVEMIADPVLADPDLVDPAARLVRAAEWWPAVERWAAARPAEEIYCRAQDLGMPFGWVVRASDILASEQLRSRGFVRELGPDEIGRLPAVGAPAKSDALPWRTGPAPSPGPVAWDRPSAPPPVAARNADAPLAGVVVLDFGTITAGAAATRLLADFGATVLKVEWRDSPDTFRSWKMPPAADVTTAPTSPYFPSNNVGKLGVAINLKTEDGRQVVRRLARRCQVVVENYRVGVTERLGIDHATLARENPDLIYLSLSSQGQHGPEARNSSYGSTLDLLSGLASVTGYDPDRPLWSSNEVNYPDQLVSLVGAALVVYCVAQRLPGADLDVSQREVVSWTLAAQIGQALLTGRDPRADGNRRPGFAPHDTYPCAEPGRWIAVSCSTDQHRRGLAKCLGADELGDRDEAWWVEHQDDVDVLIAAWSTRLARAEAVADLRAAGVPAVPVLDAADRQEVARFADHLVRLPGTGSPIKGFPLRLHHCPRPVPADAPLMGQHTRAVLREIAGLSDDEIDGLEASGAVFAQAGPPEPATPSGVADRS